MLCSIIVILIDAFLIEDRRIAVASVTTFIITSIVFFTFGFLCCHYQQKPKSTAALPIPAMNRTPVLMYENVVPKPDTEQDLELKENVAYEPCSS